MLRSSVIWASIEVNDRIFPETGASVAISLSLVNSRMNVCLYYSSKSLVFNNERLLLHILYVVAANSKESLLFPFD